MDEKRAQELVRQAIDREYVIYPKDLSEWAPKGRKTYLDGCFTSDELEAIAWCMRNDKWPK